MNLVDANWYKARPLPDLDDELIKELDKDKWVKVESSFIDALAYHKYAEVLEVRLKNGQSYTFTGIRQDVYDSYFQKWAKEKS